MYISDLDILKIGKKFRCIKDFYCGDELDYIAGKTYLCEQNGCLTDEHGYIDHHFSVAYDRMFKQHFKPVK